MHMGTQIARLRKERGLTQEALARELNVTNQAVSKWESGQSCPDLQLLPQLADLFGVTIDTLFGRNPSPADLPWQEDGVLRAVLFVGRTLVDGHPVQQELRFRYSGPALSVESAFSVVCDDVEGSVTAGGSVTCDDVFGDIQAQGNVTADVIDGSVTAGGNVTADEINGSVQAGGRVRADHMGPEE